MKMMNSWNLFFFLAVLFSMIVSLYAMEKSESDDEDESRSADIEAQVEESHVSTPYSIHHNINIQLTGIDPESPEGKKKLEQILELVNNYLQREPVKGME